MRLRFELQCLVVHKISEAPAGLPGLCCVGLFFAAGEPTSVASKMSESLGED